MTPLTFWHTICTSRSKGSRPCHLTICRFGAQKHQGQERHSDPPSSSQKQETKLLKGALSAPRRRRTFLSPGTGNQGPRDLYTQTLLNQPLRPSYILTIYDPWPRLLCPVNSSQTYCSLCLRGVKASCSGHFFTSSFSSQGVHVHKFNKIFSC